MRTNLTLSIGTETFQVSMLRKMAPQSCERLQELLPYRGPLIHARWSGNACWSRLNGVWRAGEELQPENALTNARPGQILLYAGPLSEPELFVPYGSSRFACEAGPLAGNPVITVEDVNRLAKIGQEILMRGALELKIEFSDQ